MAKKIVNVVYKVDSKELDNAKKALQANQQEAKKFDDNLKKVDKSAKDAGSSASKSFMDFKNILASISLVAIIQQLGTLGKKIFDLGVQQEQLNIAFTTFLGSAEKAKKLMAELTKFSIITPFTPDQVNKAAKALLAFGVQAEDIIPTLKMLGDVSSGTGKDLAEMAVIFGQIRSTGRLMGQDLLQLINAGFNPLQIISQKTGRSVRDLKEDMEKGLISFDMVSDAFKTATSEGGLFFNLMEKQSTTVGGKLSTIQGNFEEIGKAIFAANNGPIKDFVDYLGEITEGLLFLFETAEQKLGKNDEAIIERFKASGFTIQKELDILESKRKEIRQSIDAYGPGSDFTEDDFKKIEHEIDVIKRLGEAKEKSVKVDSEIKKKRADLSSKDADLPSSINDISGIKTQFNADDVLEFQDQLYNFEELLADYNKDKRKELEEQYQFEENLRKQKTDEELKDDESKHRRKREIQQQTFDFGVELLGTLLIASMQSNRDELTAIDEKYSREIELAGNNEQAKKTLEKRREQERKEAMKRQSQDERDQRVKTILAEALVNSVKALGLPPIPGANFIAAAQALAFGAVQAVAVGKYKDGGWITGPGTPTSDSVPIMASRDEFMVNASAASQSPMLLEAINDRKINDNILRAVTSGGGRQVSMLDDSRIVKAIQDNRVDYINQGYTLMKVQKSGENFKRIIRAKIQGY